MRLMDETGALWTLHIWFEPAHPKRKSLIREDPADTPPRQTVVRLHPSGCPAQVTFPTDTHEAPRFCTAKSDQVFWGSTECRWPDQFARKVGLKLAFASALSRDPGVMDKAKRTALWASLLRGGEKPSKP